MELESSIYTTQTALRKWEKWFRLIKNILQQQSLQKERKNGYWTNGKGTPTLKDVFICFCGPSLLGPLSGQEKYTKWVQGKSERWYRTLVGNFIVHMLLCPPEACVLKTWWFSRKHPGVWLKLWNPSWLHPCLKNDAFRDGVDALSYNWAIQGAPFSAQSNISALREASRSLWKETQSSWSRCLSRGPCEGLDVKKLYQFYEDPKHTLRCLFYFQPCVE